MKKMLIALLAVLMLTACGKQEEPAAAPSMPEEVVQTPVEEAPVVETEQEPVEIPVQVEEPQEPSPEEIPEEEFPLEWEITHVTGLIEDALAYDLEQISVSEIDGRDAINAFYEKLIGQLEAHTKETIYPAVMEQHAMANVYGKMQAISWNEEWVEVEYEYRIEYLDGSDPESFTRTDRFDVKTGEIFAAKES